MSEIKELQNVSLATTYEIDNSFDSDRFIKMRLRICHDGINPNSSFFEVENMEKAKDSIVNIPILANVIFDENNVPQFGSHDMDIEESKIAEGEYKLIYKETPIGLIPSDCNYTIEEFNDKNYVFADGYIWKSYSNYAEDIIERDKDIKLSMEILVDSFEYNSKDQYYKINDYRYSGITFLNNNLGTGMENALATTNSFAHNNSKEKFIIMMQELKDTLDQYNINNQNNITEEGGKELVDNQEKIDLLQKYNLTVETFSFNIDELSLEEIESKIKEQFSLSNSQLMTEIDKILQTMTEMKKNYWGELVERRSFYLMDLKDDNAIVVTNSWDTYYGVPYSLNGDIVTLDFEAKAEFIPDWRPKQAGDASLFTKIDEVITSEFEQIKEETDSKITEANEKFTALESEKIEIQTKLEAITIDYEKVKPELEEVQTKYSALESKVTEYETSISTLTEQFNTIKSENETLIQSNQSLAEFKSNTEIAQQEAFEQNQIQLKAELVENFSKVLTLEEVKSVQDKDLSTDEMEKEFKLLYADKDLQVKFNKKPKKVETEIPINSFTCKKKDDWTSCIKK